MKKLFIGLLLLPFSVLAQYDPGNIKIQVQGHAGSIKMGETAELAKLRLSNQTNKIITLKNLRLRNYGSARLRESFENLRVENLDYVIGSPVLIDQKSVQFSFNDIEIGRGDSLVLSVKGRLIYAKAGQTVKLGIQSKEDVKTSLKGIDYFSLNCQGCRGLRAKTQILRGGGVYITPQMQYQGYRYYGSRRAPNDISRYYRTPLGKKSYRPGSRDITFFSSYLNGRSSIRVEGVFLAIADGSRVSDKNSNGRANELADFGAAFSDFNLYINGQREDFVSGFDIYNDQVGLWFNSTTDIPANSQVLVTGRATNVAKTGDKIKLSLSKNGLIDPVYLYSGNSIDRLNINGGVSSNFTSTINEPLSISK